MRYSNIVQISPLSTLEFGSIERVHEKQFYPNAFSYVQKLETTDTYCGRVWRSLTGAIGTATAWSLDATNWLELDPVEDGADFYILEAHGCSYKFVSSLPLTYPKGFITSRWDANGNTFSEISER